MAFRYSFPIKSKSVTIRTEADLGEDNALRIVELIKNVLDEVDPFNQNSGLFKILNRQEVPFSMTAEISLFLKALNELYEFDEESADINFKNYELIMKKTFDLFLFDLLCKFFKEEITTKNFTANYSNIYYNSSNLLTDVSKEERKLIKGYYFQIKLNCEETTRNKFALSKFKLQKERVVRCFITLNNPIEYYKVKEELEKLNGLSSIMQHPEVIFAKEDLGND